jgi:hypothetical protein
MYPKDARDTIKRLKNGYSTSFYDVLDALEAIDDYGKSVSLDYEEFDDLTQDLGKMYYRALRIRDRLKEAL